MTSQCVTVLGAGSWGTALAKLAADSGHDVTLWARRPELATTIERDRQNADYLPGIRLPDGIRVTACLTDALRGSTRVIWVVPSHGLRELLERTQEQRRRLDPTTLHVSCIKGIENETLMLISEIFAEHLTEDGYRHFSVMGGPSFAKEVALGMPTAVSVASHSIDVAQTIQHDLSSSRFRIYTSDDLVGVEVGGALKNVIAIAAGCAHGMGLGINAVAALITRGLAEMSRLALALGAHPLTMSGLSGAGDLFLTCTGDLSRNRALGVALGQGQRVDEVLGHSHMVAEGFRTAKSAHQLALKMGVDMPITHLVYEVLYEGRPATDALTTIMNRALRSERDVLP